MQIIKKARKLYKNPNQCILLVIMKHQSANFVVRGDYLRIFENISIQKVRLKFKPFFCRVWTNKLFKLMNK